MVVLEELDLFEDEKALNQSVGLLKSMNGYPTISIKSSTRKSSGGLMQKYLDLAKEKKTPVYQWNIFDVTEKCESKKKCENCKLYSRCQGKLRESNGYLSLKEFETYCNETDDFTWLAEFACQKPLDKKGFFFRNLSRKDHIISVNQFIENYNIPFQEGLRPENIIPSTWMKILGMDYGYNPDSTVFLGLAHDHINDIIYIYKERGETEYLESEIIKAFEGYSKNPNNQMIKDSFNWNEERFSLLVCDSASNSTIPAINRAIRTDKPMIRKVTNQEKDRAYSYTLLRERLQISFETKKPRLIFFESCEETIFEFFNLQNTGKKPFDTKGSDHFVDACRYGISAFMNFQRIREMETRKREAHKILSRRF